MLSDFQPINFNISPDIKQAEIYFAHDIHKGSDIHDSKKWEKFKREILSAPNRFVVFVGDYFEAAIVGSKSDVYTQNCSPYEQKEWFTEQLLELKDRTIAIVPGNHDNRITKTVGLYPVYDCAVVAGLQDRYRQHWTFVSIGVGLGHGKNRQTKFVGYLAHRLRDNKLYNGSDFTDGIDFAAYGHDHDPKDHPRSKLVYDNKKNCVVQKDIEVLNSGAFMTYGGYGADSGYRPQSSKLYKLILISGNQKKLETIGFHL